MKEQNEYHHVLRNFYDKSLILQSPSEFHSVLRFFFYDALAHIDYSLCIMAYTIDSPRNHMNMEYMRWRIDEEKKGDRTHFKGFVNWLKESKREVFDSLPTLWREIYDDDSSADYRSFRISLDPDSIQPIPSQVYNNAIEEFFAPRFLKSIYSDASLGVLFEEYLSRTQ